MTLLTLRTPGPSGASRPDAAADVPAADPTPAAPVLSVEDLVVSYETRRGRHHVVHGASFTIGRGEVVALVGESGSGKTSIAQSIVGLLPGNGRLEGGRVVLGGTDLSSLGDRALRGVRGRRIGLVPQDPNHSLNPVKRIGDSVGEVLRVHGWGTRSAIDARVLELLDEVGLDDPARRARQYPHELSGGMKQRALIAAAIALNPELVIADEPTSALDVTVQRRVLDLIDTVRRDHHAAMLLVTHDLGVARERADRIVVIRDGRIVEQGPAHQVVDRPRDAYTRTLLAEAALIQGATRLRSPRVRTAPRAAQPPATAAGPAASGTAIEVVDLVHEFASGRGREPFRAVDHVSLNVPAGTTHAIVGESGSGKTTTARSVVGFVKPTSGQVTVAGIDVTAAVRREARVLRRSVQLVRQNPYSSLDPRQAIGDAIAEPLANHRIGDRAGRRRLVAEALDRVALPAGFAGRLPRELSGGQRQRVAIARALVLEPEVVVLDEPVSALDVTVQAQILRLLAELQDDLGLTYLFVSHDLGVVAHLSDTVSVMKAGRVVESGPTHEVFAHPTHDYTADLLAAIPGH